METRNRKEVITPSAPYSYRPPCAPFIHVPVIQRNPINYGQPLDLTPSYGHLDPSEVTPHELSIITRNTVQRATDRAATWSYEQRREAQSILDFLYLGPTSVIRDHAFLRREGITMIMVVRDARLANQSLASMDRAVDALGITAAYIDLISPQQLVTLFPIAIRQINRHLLDVHHGRALAAVKAGQDLAEFEAQSGSVPAGKALIACDTGNDRSAAVVAAYIMSMFDKDMVTTLQFMGLQRFCCGFDEELKRVLLTWGDIVRARSAVAMDARSHGFVDPPSESSSEASNATSWSRPLSLRQESKRRLDDLMDEMEGSPEDRDNSSADRERFEGRDTFVPFVDRDQLR